MGIDPRRKKTLLRFRSPAGISPSRKNSSRILPTKFLLHEKERKSRRRKSNRVEKNCMRKNSKQKFSFRVRQICEMGRTIDLFDTSVSFLSLSLFVHGRMMLREMHESPNRRRKTQMVHTCARQIFENCHRAMYVLQKTYRLQVIHHHVYIYICVYVYTQMY